MSNLTINKKFYTKSINRFGISAKGVHWDNKFTQYKRFQILTKPVLDDLPQSTIIDAGCGFGEYLRYLLINNIKFQDYIGYDCEPKMVQISQKRFPNYNFFIKDITKDQLQFADFYICSGAMNLLDIKQIKSFISNGYYYCNKAFCFNYLKKYTFTNISQDQIISICKQITSNIQIIEGYLENDFTIILFK